MSRVLIAMDGERIRRSALNAAYNYCEEMCLNVDVLLVGGQDEAPAVLADFLARLKRARINCRLYRGSGPLNEAVLAHVDSTPGIYVILVDSVKSWGTGVPFRALKQPVGLLSGGAL